jgi:phenylpropionate dioxygenase-like ring-hydroxylating dioxygenase large terminal subunit
VKPEVAAALLERARAVLDSGRPEMGDASHRSPVARYLDGSRFERERRLHRRSPQAVVPASTLAQAGSWWSGDVLGVPLLLTRDGGGALHAFLNVCRHRGARVAPPGEGCGRERFACPYHAWTYAPDGRLTSVPCREGFPDLQPEDAGLRRLAVAERAGLVWVVPDASCAGVDVSARLGAFAHELESFGFAGHVGHAPRELDVACDWKLMIEASSEAYHFKVAHRGTIAPLFARDAQIVDEDGSNRRMFLVKEVLRARDTHDPAPFRLRAYGNLLYYFFPSTMVLVQPDHAQVSRIEPVAVGRSRIVEVALVPEPPATAQALAHWDRNVQIYRAALAEDYAQMESMQAGMASGANDALRFGRHESALARFNAQLDAALARDEA